MSFAWALNIKDLAHREPEKTVVELDLGPNDILVLSSEERLTDKACADLKTHLQDAISKPGRVTVVISGGMKLQVLHRP